ncbi:MAG: hypothetical protein PUB97_03675 [Ruminococcus sp.]|nr:hypothetical protein [Ruminococcus sp.]
MKKLLSLLIACAMMTCAFTACGDDDDDDDDNRHASTSSVKDDEDETTTSKKTTSSKEKETTEATTDEKTTKDEDEFEFEGKWQTVKVVIDDEEYEDDIEDFPIGAFAHMELFDDGSGYLEVAGEDKNEIEWTEKSKTSIEIYNKEDNETIKFKYKNGKLTASEDDMELYFEKVKKFTEVELPTEDDDDDDKPSSGKVDKKIVGEWATTEQGFNGSYTFAENGYGSVSLDASSMFCFKGDTLVIDGSTEIGPDQYEFDGKTFVLEIEGTEFITMEKIEGSRSSLDGKYEIVSGYFYDMFDKQYKNTDDYGLFAEADGDDFWFIMANCFTFTADGDTLKVIEGAHLMNNKNITYTITGEKMTFKAGGATQILTKK